MRRSPCFDCHRLTRSKTLCATKCKQLGWWRDLDSLPYPPVPVERVRFEDLRMGDSCLVQMSDVVGIWQIRTKVRLRVAF